MIIGQSDDFAENQSVESNSFLKCFLTIEQKTDNRQCKNNFLRQEVVINFSFLYIACTEDLNIEPKRIRLTLVGLV